MTTKPDHALQSLCGACSRDIVVSTENPIYWVRSNIAAFQKQMFPLWRCPQCQSLTNLLPTDYSLIYQNYPLQKRKLDALARPAFKNLLKRLKQQGLQMHHRILDFGCGNGVFLEFLHKEGFENAEGFDPFDAKYKYEPSGLFDVIIANDVIEHLEKPIHLLEFCRPRLNKTGFIYVGTTCTDQLDFKKLDNHLMLLHQPYHRVIFSLRQFHRFFSDNGFKIEAHYERSYMDTLVPFANYRFLDELNKGLGQVMDLAFEPISPFLFLHYPMILFSAFFGYFIPSTDEPAVVVRENHVLGRSLPSDGSTMAK